MMGSKSLAKSVAGLLLGFGAVVALSASANAVEIPVETVGFVVPDGDASGTLVQRVNLGLAGTSAINTIVLTDTSNGNFGDPGIFSGYDLDAFVLDRDGNIATTGDQVAFSGLSLAFTGGTIRPTGTTGGPQDPSPPNNIGTHFGTNNAGNIVGATATLDTFDGVNVASIFNSDGFLTLGDGGELILTFADVLVDGGLYLIFGEVGGQGESLRVEVPGQVPLPGAVWLFLSAIAILFGISRRRNIATA